MPDSERWMIRESVVLAYLFVVSCAGTTARPGARSDDVGSGGAGPSDPAGSKPGTSKSLPFATSPNVRSCADSEEPSTCLLATNQPGPSAIVAADGWVYWATDKAIAKVPATG